MSTALSALQTLEQALSALEAVLTQEAEALRCREAEAIQTLSARKEEVAQAIAQAWGGLMTALGLPDMAPVQAVEQALIDTANPRIVALWAPLRARIMHSSQLNRLNGLLIEQQWQHTKRALEVLALAAGGVYGADGQNQGVHLIRDIDEA